MAILLAISKYAIPVVIGYIVLYGVFHKIPVYEAFLSGVKDGFQMVVSLAPTLIGLLVAVGIFRASGCLSLLCSLFAPLTDTLHIPSEVIPVSIVRIFSSSAATGMTLDVFDTFGPDSAVGNIISVMMSSTETVFYTISVYFLAIGVTKTRWTLAGALLCSAIGVAASIILGSMM